MMSSTYETDARRHRDGGIVQETTPAAQQYNRRCEEASWDAVTKAGSGSPVYVLRRLGNTLGNVARLQPANHVAYQPLPRGVLAPNPPLAPS